MKQKLHLLVTALVLILGIHSSPAQPTNLSIAPAGNQIILYWPTNTPSNLVLQSSTNPAGSNWTAVVDGTPITAIILSNTVPARYFRFYNPNLSSTNGMVPVAAGTYQIGDNLDGYSDAPVTSITLTAYYMDANLVSSTRWQSVYSWATNNGYTFNDSGAAKDTNHPIESVDWYDAVKWCNARSQIAALTPVYYTDPGFSNVYTSGEVTVYANFSTNGYQLPTEAQWEVAARGGLVGMRYPYGNTISKSQANYYSPPGNSNSSDLGPSGYSAAYQYGNYPYTSPVGSFPANGYGLYDMAGNVFEWCYDWYYPSYAYTSGTNPTGPSSGSNRILRGGSWENDASTLACARRLNGSPGGQGAAFTGGGFRCVKTQ